MHMFVCQPLFVRIIKRLRDWFDLAVDKLLRYFVFSVYKGKGKRRFV